jgi:hypothetical protein
MQLEGAGVKRFFQAGFISTVLSMAWGNCYQPLMTFRSACLKIAFVGLSLGLTAGCARPPAPVPVNAPAPVAPDPSPQALKAAWQKGYNAGYYQGKRDQARRDQALIVHGTLPPPPPPGTAAADTPAPAVVQPPVTPAPALPPASVFVPAGPAQPVTAAP